jgi:uncharacterized membrane protein YGL010W
MSINAAMVITTVLLAYYLALDFALGIAMVLAMGILLWIGQQIASQGTVAGWGWFAILFVGGWILQLAGHIFEGRRPALADNLFQIFVAPIFLCAEAFFALGYKPRLQAAVMERAREMRAAA